MPLLECEPHLLTETSQRDHLPIPRDACGDSMEVTDVRSHHDAGPPAANRGVAADLSDGVRIGVTITGRRT